MSDTEQSQATLSRSSQFSIGKQSTKYMASSDTDDDIIISSALLIASTISQRRQVNVRKRQRNSWACKQTILTAGRHSKKLPKNRDVSIYSNLVVRLVKSWATRDARKHFEQQTCSTKVLDFVACLR